MSDNNYELVSIDTNSAIGHYHYILYSTLENCVNGFPDGFGVATQLQFIIRSPNR